MVSVQYTFIAEFKKHLSPVIDYFHFSMLFLFPFNVSIYFYIVANQGWGTSFGLALPRH